MGGCKNSIPKALAGAGMQEEPGAYHPEREGVWLLTAGSELQDTDGLGNCNKSM